MNNYSTETPPDFAEGLSRLLSGIRAHMSSSIISPPLAHLLVCQDSRFTFSHGFSFLLVSQIKAHLDDKDIEFKLRHCKGKGKKKLIGQILQLMILCIVQIVLLKWEHMS